MIKSGNANGTSQLTPPLKFIAADEYIVETPKRFDQTPSVVGALMAVIIVIVLIGLGVWYYRGGRKLMSRSGSLNNSNR